MSKSIDDSVAAMLDEAERARRCCTPSERGLREAIFADSLEDFAREFYAEYGEN